MISRQAPYILLDDLRGGINDSDTPTALPENQLVDCRNVDYRFGQIGQKRGGTSPISLAGSVFLRNIPSLTQRDVGGWTAAASGSFATTTVTGSNTNQIMIVTISLAAAQTVSAVTLGGVALTRLGGLANTAQIDIWYLRQPALAGGTLAITLAGSTDAHVYASRYDNVDQANSPVSLATGSASTTLVNGSSASFSSIHRVLQAVAGGNTLSAGTNVNILNSASGVHGGANGLIVEQLGMKPTTLFNSSIASAVAWAEGVFGLLGLTNTTGTPLTWIETFTPTNDPLGNELWAMDTAGRLDRMVGGVWQGGVPVVNYQVGSFISAGYWTNGVSLHGKFFLALDGTKNQDRMHVWDPVLQGGVLRWGGFATPNACTVVTTGSGSYSGTRYFRFRYIQQNSGITVRRSEPCAVQTFTPPGTGSGALITLPASGGFTFGEGETHWEIEASTDGVNFYVIAVQAVGTTTYTDTTSGTTGYTLLGPLSPLLADYTPMLSVRHVVADGDRLLAAGSYTVPQSDSRCYWTVLTADLGVGNDERVPVGTRHFLDLDGLYGGRINMCLPATMAGIIVLKDQRVYKLLRTGQPAKAYADQMLTPARGTVQRCGTYGTDENGQPCVYFWDPNVGACRYGQSGFEDLMQQRRRTVQRVNLSATVVPKVLFYPKHWLVWFFVPLDASPLPNYCFCFNVRQRTTTDYDGNMATAVGGTIFKDRTSLQMRPYLVVSTASTSGIVEADKGVNDDGVRFRGYFRTRAYAVGEFLKNFRIKWGAVFGKAAAGVTIGLSLIRDFGAERIDKTASIDPGVSGSTWVEGAADDAYVSECKQAQIEIGDPITYVGAQLDQTWQLDFTGVKFGVDEEIVVS